LSDAFSVANAWTQPGGVLKLLKDWTVKLNGNNTAAYMSIDPITNTYHAHDATIDDDLYGYWIDLGGHTLTANMARPLFGSTDGSAVNIRNGRIIYRNQYSGGKSTGHFKGAITFSENGGTVAPFSDNTDASTLKVGRATLYNAELIAINEPTQSVNHAAITTALWSNEIRLYNGSKVLSYSGEAVSFYLSKATVSDAALTYLQENGVQDVVALYGGSVLGSLQNGSNGTVGSNNDWTTALRYQSYDNNSYTQYSGTYEGIDHVVAVTADETSKFLGSGMCLDRSGPYDLTVSEPEGTQFQFSDYSYARPDVTTIGEHMTETKPDDLAAENYAGFYYANHTHGENVTSHPAEAATFAADGHSAYYECDCGQLFLDEACTVPTTLEEVTTDAKLVDASGYTDAQLVELGAVIRATAPEAATDKAYDNILDGYNEAKTWTEAGGTLKLLTDVTIDIEGNFAGGYLTAESYDYDNTEVAGMATKGFWLDLGGHTIRASLGRALIYSERSTYTNVKNGTIIFTDNGRQTNSGGATTCFGIFTYGGSSVGSDKAPSINLYQVNCYALKTEGHKTDPSVIASYCLNTTVNAKESKLITDSGEPAIETYRSSSTAAGITDANININLTGGSTVGSLTETTNAMYFGDYKTTTAAIDGVTYRINVNADSDTTFLGNAPTAVADSIAALYTVTTPDSTYACVTRNLAFPAIGLDAADYKAWVDPLADAAGLTTDDPAAAKATLTYGGNTVYFTEIADALTYAETIGSQTLPTKVTLNADATETVKLGAEGRTSAFTLDLNGFEIPEAGLIEAGGGAGTKITITIAAGAAGEAAIFAGIPALAYADGSAFVIEKGSLFTDYSLNLEDHVKMNLYTNDADGVSYVQGGTTYVIDAKDDRGAWIVDTIAARQMFEPIDAYAVKTEGTTTTIDFTKGISIKRYVDGDPAATLAEGAEKTALEATLETLLIYGKFAEKYFASDYTDLSADELTALGIDAIPVTDTTNLTDAAYAVTGMDDLQYAPEGTGFYGIVAEPDESMSLKFYFSGDVFDGKTATVNGEAAEVETFGDYKFVTAAVRARDFDTAITVAIDGVGSVTDSVSGYTSRMTHANTVKLGQALRAYGANAMRYAAAKDAAQG
ncbi:MAG: hypothetical protein Q3977_04105, partial [Oscillospiraceae bacterium]|nr:hypothetical protein [Oscillospiraceae bacterium]